MLGKLTILNQRRNRFLATFASIGLCVDIFAFAQTKSPCEANFDSEIYLN